MIRSPGLWPAATRASRRLVLPRLQTDGETSPARQASIGRRRPPREHAYIMTVRPGFSAAARPAPAVWSAIRLGYATSFATLRPMLEPGVPCIQENDHGQWQRIGSENCGYCQRGAGGAQESRKYGGILRAGTGTQDQPKSRCSDSPHRPGLRLHLGSVQPDCFRNSTGRQTRSPAWYS